MSQPYTLTALPRDGRAYLVGEGGKKIQAGSGSWYLQD